MTWVIGATSMFGHSIVVSDTRVTCSASGHFQDMLRKSFYVGKYLVAGFAGDVQTGFDLIANITALLNPPDLEDDEYWKPSWVAENWPPIAREVFRRIVKVRQASETHILLAGVDAAPEGAFPQGAPSLAVFRSPLFEPEILSGLAKVTSIGSGSHVAEYREGIQYLVKDPEFVYAKGEMWRSGGQAIMIANMIQHIAKKNPADGVSQHFHYSLIELGRVQQWESPEMHKVACNWSEVEELLDNRLDTASLVACRNSCQVRRRFADHRLCGLR